jgi:hypothetical protein
VKRLYRHLPMLLALGAMVGLAVGAYFIFDSLHEQIN